MILDNLKPNLANLLFIIEKSSKLTKSDIVFIMSRPRSLDAVDDRGMPLDWITMDFSELLEITEDLNYMWKTLKRKYGWSFKFAVFPVNGSRADAFIKPEYHGYTKTALRLSGCEACAFPSESKVAEYIIMCWENSNKSKTEV